MISSEYRAGIGPDFTEKFEFARESILSRGATDRPALADQMGYQKDQSSGEKLPVLHALHAQGQQNQIAVLGAGYAGVKESVRYRLAVYHRLMGDEESSAI